MALFASAVLLTLRLAPGLAQRPLRRLAVVVLPAAAGVAVLTEFLQGFVGRDPSLGDVGRDLLGAALALAFFAPASKRLPRATRLALRGALLLVLATEAAPLALAVADEVAASRSFPLLAGFESPRELGRWGGDARFRLTREVARQGRGSLGVELGTEQYSGVALHHFPADWRGYRTLHFSVYNPSAEPLTLVCRVHDAHHREHGNAYADRFNRRLAIQPGWNDVDIPLDAVRTAPATRPLDLGRVAGFALFAVRLPAPRRICLDDLRLVR